MFDKSGQLADAIEATDNFLDAQGWDDAAELGLSVAGFLWDPNHSSMHLLLSFATRVSGELPGSHPSAHLFADYAAQALAVLGLTGRAVELAEDNLARCAARVSAEPGRADYQRDLSVSHNKLGDLDQALGRGQDADHRRLIASSNVPRPLGRWRLTLSNMSSTSPEHAQ